MVKTCRDKGVMLGVMFQQRTDGVRRKMHEMVSSGVLGELHRVAMTVPWYRPQAYYDSGAWRGTWKGEGGGVLMNQAPHNLDQFVWLGGMPQSVQALALTRHHKIEVDNTGLAIFDYGNGKVGWLYVSTAELSTGERVELAGEKGALILDAGKLRHFVAERPMVEHLRTETSMFGGIKGEWHDVEVEEVASGHTEVTRAFARAIRAGDESLMVANGEDGVRALEIANAMLLAGFTHKEVELPVNRGKFERMLKKLQQGASSEEFKGK
jgi:predicted dehydrogenase